MTLGKVVWGAVVVLGFALSAEAQSIDSYRIQYYAPGAAAPMQNETFTAAAAQCNQAPISSADTINPSRVSWADPNAAGRTCLYVPPTGATLFSLPVGSYEATLVAINSLGSSGESNRAPFSRAAVPSAPVGFRLIR